MNNFREWLSDNLRYFMLGFGILLVIIALFFGLRFVSSHTNNGSTEAENLTETPTPTETPEITETPTPTEVPEEALVRNGVPEVKALVDAYYAAIGAKDMEALRATVDTLSEEDATQIQEDTSLEGYSNINVYTTASQEEGTYLAFVSYEYKLAGIDTQVPGLTQLLIRQNAEGNEYIVTETPDATTQQWIDDTMRTDEVQQLVEQVQTAYDTALESDPALNAYFNPDQAQETAEPTPEATPEPTAEPTPEPTPEPTAEPTPEPTPEIVTMRSAANMRDGASNDANIIGEYPAGTQLEKLGEGDGWFHVRINGTEGYIAARFF